ISLESMVLDKKIVDASGLKSALVQKIRAHQATTGVIGMGYVGLPLLMEYARGGYQAIGFDINPEKVRQVNAGQSYIQDVPTSELREQVQDTRRLRGTTEFGALAQCDTVNICVPTPLRKTKDP